MKSTVISRSRNIQSDIAKAELVWKNRIHPHSCKFNDHYYSIVDGFKESIHVFIEGNQLVSRWGKLEPGETFCIIETGFGSGLNFLTTWQLWQKFNFTHKNSLYYISVEAYPLNYEQLQKSLNNWKSDLAEFSEELLRRYPPLTAGSHNIHFNTDNIKLCLLFGDIAEQLPAVECTASGLADAWFLDGFAPSKNPEMWQDDLYTQIRRLSRQGATVATYTVAGIVRRGLAEVGFNVSKKPGFGTKRDMLFAQLD